MKGDRTVPGASFGLYIIALCVDCTDIVSSVTAVSFDTKPICVNLWKTRACLCTT